MIFYSRFCVRIPIAILASIRRKMSPKKGRELSWSSQTWELRSNGIFLCHIDWWCGGKLPRHQIIIKKNYILFFFKNWNFFSKNKKTKFKFFFQFFAKWWEHIVPNIGNSLIIKHYNLSIYKWYCYDFFSYVISSMSSLNLYGYNWKEIATIYDNVDFLFNLEQISRSPKQALGI